MGHDYSLVRIELRDLDVLHQSQACHAWVRQVDSLSSSAFDHLSVEAIDTATGVPGPYGMSMSQTHWRSKRFHRSINAGGVVAMAASAWNKAIRLVPGSQHLSAHNDVVPFLAVNTADHADLLAGNALASRDCGCRTQSTRRATLGATSAWSFPPATKRR
jgi:hypothetical protein